MPFWQVCLAALGYMRRCSEPSIVTRLFGLASFLVAVAVFLYFTFPTLSLMPHSVSKFSSQTTGRIGLLAFLRRAASVLSALAHRSSISPRRSVTRCSFSEPTMRSCFGRLPILYLFINYST